MMKMLRKTAIKFFEKKKMILIISIYLNLEGEVKAPFDMTPYCRGANNAVTLIIPTRGTPLISKIEKKNTRKKVTLHKYTNTFYIH